MEIAEYQTKFYAIFETVMRDNIKMIHGNSKWLNKLKCFYNNSETIEIRIPAMVLMKGTKSKIAKTDTDKSVDKYMGGGDYTYLDFCLKKAAEIFTTDLNMTMLKQTEE